MTEQITSKRCTGCGQVKLLQEFHRHPNGLGGRSNRCKTCAATYDRAWRQANQERLRAYDQARYLADPKRRYEGDPEVHRARNYAWRAANPEKVKETKRRTRQAKRASISQYNRQYRQANLKHLRERDRQRYRQRQAAVLAHYGETCACCGATERLSIDHIDGNGAAHRREIFGHNRGGGMYRWLIAQGFPSGFQTLCVPCNQSKKSSDRCRLEH